MAETTCMIETTGYPELKSLRTELVCCFSILQYLSVTVLIVPTIHLADLKVRTLSDTQKSSISVLVLLYEVHLVRFSLIQKFFNGAKVFVAKHFKVTAVQFSNSFDNINRDFGTE